MFADGFIIMFWSGLLLTLIYLAWRRYQIKQTEDFEDRDN